jgi:hypothetical protein
MRRGEKTSLGGSNSAKYLNSSKAKGSLDNRTQGRRGTLDISVGRNGALVPYNSAIESAKTNTIRTITNTEAKSKAVAHIKKLVDARTEKEIEK